MAKLFLDATDTSYKVSNGNTEVFGANGDQAITIDGNLTGVVLDANVERVAFTGSTTDYTYKQVGTDLEVYKGTTLVTKVGLQDDTTGTQLTFANGTVDAKFAPSATGLGLTVGGQTVSATAPTAVTIPAANIDVTTFPITSPTFSVASVAATATEGSNAVFTVTLANPATTATTVEYTLTNLTGATNADTSDETISGTGVTGVTSTSTNVDGPYTGSLTFAAGATTATISLPVSLDGLTETTEAMSLTLSNPTGGAIVNDAGKVATVSFVDAPATTFTLTSTGTGVETQEGSSIVFTVTPNAPVNVNTTLVLNVQGQALGAVTSTTSAADFETTPSVTFAQGETAAKTITLKVATDTAVEGREAYAANVIDTTTYVSRGNTVTGVVTDKLPTLSLSQNVTSVNEGSTVTYTVTADEAAPAGGFVVPFTVSGTATSGTDYTALTASNITIAAGAKTGSVTLTTIADTATEGDETVIVTLGTVTNANVSTTASSVTTTIADTSKALGTAEMTLTGATSVDEGSTVTYTVTLGSAATTALSIPYTVAGTATSGTDYTGSTGTITVAAGAKTGTLTLTTAADATTETAETIIVTLGTVTGFTAVTGQGAVTTTINDTSLTPVAVPGSTFTLTSGSDMINANQAVLNGGTVVLTYKPTTGDDTFNAIADGLLATGDSLDGVGGTDTLNSRHTITAAKIIAPTTRNIAIHNVRLDHNGGAADAVTYDMSDISGATEVWSDRSVNSGSTADAVLTFSGTGMTTAVSTGIRGGDTGADNSSIDVTSTYQNVTGSADSATLKLNGAAANVVTIAGIETLNIVSSTTETSASTTGASKLNSLVAVNAKTVNVSGNGKVTLSATNFDDTTGYKVDASSMSTGGYLLATLEASTKQTVVGSNGNDEILVTTSVETSDSFDGGAGTADVFGHTEGTDVAATVTNIKNFEVLDVTGSNTQTYNLSYYSGSSISTVRATGAITTSVTVNKLPENGTLLLTGATGAADVTINHTSKDDVGFTGGTLNIKYAGDANINDTATVTVGGAATVNIDAGAATASTAKGTYTHKIDTALTASMMTKLVVTGSQNLTIDAFTSSSALVNVDASKMTGNFVMTAALVGTGSTLIKGGDGDDTLTPNNGAITEIWGGKGLDTIALGATSAKGTYVLNSYLDGNAAGVIDGTKDDAVTGFVRGQDKIGISESFLQTLGNKDTTLSVNVVSAANQAVGTNDVFVFTNNGTGTLNLTNLKTAVGAFTGSSVNLELLIVHQGAADTAYSAYHFKDGDGDGVLDDGEITLIGTLTVDTGANLATSDFAKVTGTY